MEKTTYKTTSQMLMTLCRLTRCAVLALTEKNGGGQVQKGGNLKCSLKSCFDEFWGQKGEALIIKSSKLEAPTLEPS